MSGVAFVLTVVAGGAGAGLRYLVDLAVARRLGARFPWGTLVVNVTGSFALGLLVGTGSDAALLPVLGVGLLGGYTTFSSVAAVTAVLVRERRRVAAVVNALGTLLLTVAAAAAGIGVGGLF